MAGTLPPLFEITADDHGGYSAVAVYTLLALTIVIVSTRLSTRWFIGRVVHPDDILLGISLVSLHYCRSMYTVTDAAACEQKLLGIIQSVFAQLAISNGLGRRLLNIGDHQLEMYLKVRMRITVESRQKAKSNEVHVAV